MRVMPYRDPAAQREYQRKWLAGRRDAWLEGKWCVRCGTSSDLQIDHIDPRRKVEHRIWSWSEDRRVAELEKCQVLCDTCHREKSSSNGDYGRTLSLEDVRLIRTVGRTVIQKDLAARFGVTQQTISAILIGKRWARAT